jgi:hypothetical protein
MNAKSILILLGALSIPPVQAENCVDWLDAWHSKPEGATFLGCAAEPVADGEQPASLYRLAPGSVEPAEALLIKQFGMAPLAFVCCGWEPPRKGQHRVAGQYYQIALHSAETLANRREDWPAIDFFIRVQPLEEP